MYISIQFQYKYFALFSRYIYILCAFLDIYFSDSEVSLLSKGLNFRPTPRDFDRYSLRIKDFNDFVRHISLKEYFYDGDNVEGDFSNVPAFRNTGKSVWYSDQGRELAIEAYAQAVEEEIRKGYV